MSFNLSQSNNTIESENELTHQDLISKSIPTKTHIKMIEVIYLYIK